MNMQSEEWRPVVGWEDLYEVSNCGRVRSLPREVEARNRWGGVNIRRMKGKTLSERPHPGGYRYVSLCRDGEPKNKYIHRAVLEAFVGECPGGMECRHKNGIPSDNRLENLHWGIHIENVWDRDGHGTMLRGEQIHQSKIVEQDVIDIRKMYATGEYRQSELAEMYGVTQTNVGNIVRGKTWRRAGGEITNTGLGCYARKPKTQEAAP